MALPASYRRLCGGNLVVTVSVSLHEERPLAAERCLWLYPEPEWAQVEGDLNRIPASNLKGVRLRRVLVGSAHDVELDDAGRLVIPAQLRSYAGLDKNVVLVGQGRKLELWDEAVWNRNFEQALEEGFLDDNGALSADLQALVL